MTDDAMLIVGADEAGQRIDSLVAEHVSGVSRSLARKLVDEGRVRVGDDVVKPSHRVHEGETIRVEVVMPPAISAAPEDIPLTIVYQDKDLAIIDKPAGLVVHPAAGHAGGTLANALAATFPQTQAVGDPLRPGIVHRLDKDTSGLMVVALRPEAQVSLQHQIATRRAERRYLALATGHVSQRSATIRAPIGRDPRDRKRMSTHGIAAREAETSYTVREYLDGFTLLEARLRTGRTHQIRVHLAAIGHPIAGDNVYGGAPVEGLNRQFLHAYLLSLDSPSSGERVTFRSALPADLDRVLERLGHHA